MVYHCRPDQESPKNKQLKIDPSITYNYLDYGYGYWTTNVKGECKVVKGKLGEVNKIRSTSKELYEKFDQCKETLRKKANEYFHDLKEKPCMGIEKVQDMTKNTCNFND